MKSVFEASTRAELISRISSLSEQSKARWGKMNLFQMLKHCTAWEEMIHQNKKYKRPLMGLLFGNMFLKKELKEDSVMRQNSPTIPELRVKETVGDIEVEKKKWKSLINQYVQYSLPDYSFVHPFFGRMTKEQVGYFAYKHSDHHLRQFDA